jgi:exopolyphosphatase/guanosine-5'-triphosphate,3'-diphosphate pyrophosphatase
MIDQPADGNFIGAIDVGSNAMRLGIAARDAQGQPQIIHRYREPVRLGHDAFTSGILSQSTMNDAVAAFHQFRRILDQYHITQLRAMATSAMRDSENGQELARRIHEETGIQINIIGGEEEARLIHYSLAHRVKLSDHFALLIDIGGGSVEITLCDNGEIIAAQSFNIGTVRLLEMLGDGNPGAFNKLLGKYIDGTRKKLRQQIGTRQADICLGTGGNAAAIGELVRQLFNTGSADQVSRKQLAKIISRLSLLSFEERVRNLGLRPDRADVILPAAMIFHEIMVLAKADRLTIPNASLLDGMLLDMVDSEKNNFHSRRRNLLAWARSLKQKYHVDQQYADAVSALALTLFDQSRSLHQLGDRERLLLEIGARVHEIGMYIRVGSHHRHAAYLISVSPLLGLTDNERKLLAQFVRYQRKACPCQKHEGFTALGKSDQQKVWHLSALLRLAIALNKERRNRVNSVRMEIGNKEVTLHPEGQGDLLLERWAILNTTDYFEQAFHRKLHIDLNLAS